MGGKHSEEQVKKYMEELDTDKSGDISFEEFSIWYLRGEARIETELSETFDELDDDHNGYLTKDELVVLLERLGHEVANKPTVLDGMFKMLDTDHDNKISKEIYYLLSVQRRVY